MTCDVMIMYISGDQVVMYSDLKYQNPVTDVDYHPRDHMIAFCSLGENHPVLLYSYDVQGNAVESQLQQTTILRHLTQFWTKIGYYIS